MLYGIFFFFSILFFVYNVHRISVGWVLRVGWELPLHGQYKSFWVAVGALGMVVSNQGQLSRAVN